jgi:hypothetical protein
MWKLKSTNDQNEEAREKEFLKKTKIAVVKVGSFYDGNSIFLTSLLRVGRSINCDQQSISSTLNERIFHSNVVSAAFFSYMYVVKATETTLVQKIRTFNVDEIDTSYCPSTQRYFDRYLFLPEI